MIGFLHVTLLLVGIALGAGLAYVIFAMPAQEENKTLRHRLESDPFDLSAAMARGDTLKTALAAMTEQKDALLELAAKQKETLDAIRKAFE